LDKKELFKELESLDKDTNPRFELMNQALKERAENFSTQFISGDP